MLIWIDGPAGCGKSTSLRTVESMIGNEKCLFWDSDWFDKEYKKEKGFAALFGGTSPLNNKGFHEYFRKKIDDEIKNKALVVAMSLTVMEGKRDFYDYYNNDPSVDFRHVILTADKETIKSRINNQTGRKQKDVGLSYLDEYLDFLERYYKEDIWINTTDKSPEETAEKIIEVTGLSKLHKDC